MLGTIQISGSHLSDAQVGDICESVASHRVPLLTLRKCRTKDRQFQVINACNLDGGKRSPLKSAQEMNADTKGSQQFLLTPI